MDKNKICQNANLNTETLHQLTKRVKTTPLKTNCPYFDEKNLVKPGSFVQFKGGNGTGKSALLMELIITNIIPLNWNGYELNGNEKGVLLFDHDFKFDFVKLSKLLQNRVTNTLKQIFEENQQNQNLGELIEKINPEEESEEDEQSFFETELLHSCLARVKVIRCKDTEQFTETLTGQPNDFWNNYIKANQITILVIDSYTSFYWIDRWEEPYATQRQQKLARALKKIVSSNNLVLFYSKQELFSKKSQNFGTRDLPTTIKLEFKKNGITGEDQPIINILLYSNSLTQPRTHSFVITNEGIVFLE